MPPEAKKITVCLDKLGDGAGMPPEAVCSSTLIEFPCKLLEVEPGPFSATKEALTASMITAIRAGSWTRAATTGAETVEEVCGAKFAAEASDKGTDDSVCRTVSDGGFSPSKLLLVRRAVIVKQKQQTSKNQSTKWHANSKLLQQHFAKNCKQATAYISHEVPLLEASGHP